MKIFRKHHKFENSLKIVINLLKNLFPKILTCHNNFTLLAEDRSRDILSETLITSRVISGSIEYFVHDGVFKVWQRLAIFKPFILRLGRSYKESNERETMCKQRGWFIWKRFLPPMHSKIRYEPFALHWRNFVLPCATIELADDGCSTKTGAWIDSFSVMRLNYLVFFMTLRNDSR